jgi:hypothetical protein
MHKLEHHDGNSNRELTSWRHHNYVTRTYGLTARWHAIHTVGCSFKSLSLKVRLFLYFVLLIRQAREGGSNFRSFALIVQR